MSDKPLPPLPNEAFDGEKESTEIKFVKCEHELYLVSPEEVRCKKCTVGYTGHGVAMLLQTLKQK